MPNKQQIEGFRDSLDEYSKHLKEKYGFLPADLELLGILMYEKYKGESDKLESSLKRGTDAIKEAEEFLNKLNKL